MNDFTNILQNPKDLFDQIRQYGVSACKTGVSMALHLYFVMISPQTSVQNKTIIAAALAYQFLPKQILSREKHGVLGIADNVLTLAIVYNRVQASITPEITEQVNDKLQEWGF